MLAHFAQFEKWRCPINVAGDVEVEVELLDQHDRGHDAPFFEAPREALPLGMPRRNPAKWRRLAATN
jgi:hypothetical protein